MKKLITRQERRTLINYLKGISDEQYGQLLLEFNDLLIFEKKNTTRSSILGALTGSNIHDCDFSRFLLKCAKMKKLQEYQSRIDRLKRARKLVKEMSEGHFARRMMKYSGHAIITKERATFAKIICLGDIDRNIESLQECLSEKKDVTTTPDENIERFADFLLRRVKKEKKRR